MFFIFQKYRDFFYFFTCSICALIQLRLDYDQISNKCHILKYGNYYREALIRGWHLFNKLGKLLHFVIKLGNLEASPLGFSQKIHGNLKAAISSLNVCFWLDHTEELFSAEGVLALGGQRIQNKLSYTNKAIFRMYLIFFLF